MIEAPEPLEEPQKPYWKPDPFDRFLPREKGFIHDFVLSLRGTQVPVAFSLWASLLLLSSAIKRESWLQWKDGTGQLFPNFYVVFVAPAGRIKKGTVINHASWILKHMQEYIVNYNIRQTKEMKVFEDKLTGEGLAKFFKLYMRGGKTISFVDQDGKPLFRDGQPLIYKKTGELTIIAEELGTLMSQAKYNADLTTSLTRLYNTTESFQEITVKRGRLNVPFLCTNFLGGTTPDAFRDSIPKSAINEGFLSRTIICYVPRPIQPFSRPQAMLVPREELASRLGWIAEHTAGEWILSSEAFSFYDCWYRRMFDHFDSIRFHPSHQARMDVHALKISMLLMAQRYRSWMQPKTRIIDLAAIRDAIRILEFTLETAPAILEDVGASPLMKTVGRILNYMEEHKGRVTRRALLQNMRLSAVDTTAIICDMFNSGRIRAFKGKQPLAFPQHALDEIYRPAKRTNKTRKTNADDETDSSL